MTDKRTFETKTAPRYWPIHPGFVAYYDSWEERTVRFDELSDKGIDPTVDGISGKTFYEHNTGLKPIYRDRSYDT